MSRRLLLLVALATVLLAVAAPAASAQDADAPVRIDTSRADRAIAWFRAHAGETSWEGYCERAVESSYGTIGRFADARANWNSKAVRQHYDWRMAPLGALVFWNTSAHAHVAVSLGDGTVVSTSAGGRVGHVPMTWFGIPLGWKPVPWR